MSDGRYPKRPEICLPRRSRFDSKDAFKNANSFDRAEELPRIEQLKIEEISDTGVTVIHGRNEAGKTTILKAIEALFNINSAVKPPALNHYKPSTLMSADAAMEFSVGPYREIV